MQTKEDTKAETKQETADIETHRMSQLRGMSRRESEERGEGTLTNFLKKILMEALCLWYGDLCSSWSVGRKAEWDLEPCLLGKCDSSWKQIWKGYFRVRVGSR